MTTISPEPGSVSIDSINGDEVLTREAAAQAIGLKSVRHLYRYIRRLLIFSDNFKRFEHPITGRVNGAVRVTTRDLIELQRLRELYKKHRTTAQVMIELAKIYNRGN